jgi:hypothetical protein
MGGKYLFLNGDMERSSEWDIFWLCRSSLLVNEAPGGASLDVTGVTPLAKKARKGRAAGAW